MKRKARMGNQMLMGQPFKCYKKKINTVQKIFSISDCGELILSALRMPQYVVRISYPFGSFFKKMTIDYI